MTVAPVVLADDTTRAAILDVEERRQRALLEVDLDTLRALYDDSLIHTHAPGLTHTKAQLLEHIATRAPYKGATRGELMIRVIGDVAIMTGRLINRLGGPDGSERTVAGQVIQVLRRCEDGAWRFVSFQMTPDGEHVWTPTAEEKAGLDRIAQEEQ